MRIRISSKGPIVFTYVLFGVGNGTECSKTYRVYRVFFFQNVLLWRDGLTDGRVDGWTVNKKVL